MPVTIYPSVAKIKRNGVYENLPGFVPETGSVATQQMIATAESINVAQYAHNKGEYFRLNDTLYQAIVKINVGDSIVVGTNCEVAVLGNDVSHIANSIAEYELGIATAPHTTGEYFMVGETMYVATADIQVGDNISTSTNCRLAVVGDELSGLKTAITDLDEDVNGVSTFNYIKGKNFSSNTSSHNIIDDPDSCITDYIPVSWPSGYVRWWYTDDNEDSKRYEIWFYDSTKTWIGYKVRNNTGTNSRNVNDAIENGYVRFSFKKGFIGKLTNISTPPTTTYFEVGSEKIPGLSQKVNGLIAKYGIKWSLTDPDDLGSRCFDAVGLSATIGIGNVDGTSDFDSIYPWSEIKRCNIKKTAAGAEIVTFEGEAGFALDGTNGDVFVRIPVFYYDKYVEDGCEYRFISEKGKNVHPAFIENGEILPEIFVSAYEGSVSGTKLKSIAGVIPTNCIYAQDFLDSAVANGDNYSLYDSRCVDAIWNLMAIEYGCRNTNQVLGYGFADYEQPVVGNRHDVIEVASNTNKVKTSLWTTGQKKHMPVGSNITICSGNQTTILTQAKITAVTDGADYTEWTFDGDPVSVDTNCFIGSAPCTTGFTEDAPSGGLNWHTGRANWISESTTMNPTRYRWIENLIGSAWNFLPDISFNDLQMYVCKNMKDYQFGKITSPYYPVGESLPENNDNGNKSDVTGANYWITSLVNDYLTKATPFGKTYDKSLTSTKAFGAYYYLKSGNVFISNGGGFDHLYRCNMLTNRAWQTATTKSYLYGARLMYKHLV